MTKFYEKPFKVAKKVVRNVKKAAGDLYHKAVYDPYLGGSEKKAAAALEDASKRAGLSWQEYGQQAPKFYATYKKAGEGGLNTYLSLLKGSGVPNLPETPQLPTIIDHGDIPQYAGTEKFSFSPSDLTTDPSYQFRLNQGLEAVNRSAGALGRRLSGNRAVALNDYAQNAASQEYQNAFNRALETSRENVGRGLTDYQIGRENEASQYSRDIDIHDRNIRTLMQQYGLDYQRASDLYQAHLGKMDRYGKLANMGLSTSNALAGILNTATQGKTGAIMKTGQAQASAELGSANALRGLAGAALGAAGSYFGSNEIAKALKGG